MNGKNAVVFRGKKADAMPKILLLPDRTGRAAFLIRASHVICSLFLSYASSPLANQLVLCNRKAVALPRMSLTNSHNSCRVRCAAIAGGVLRIVDEKLKRDSQADTSSMPSTRHR